MCRGMISWKTLMAALLAVAFVGAAVPSLVGDDTKPPVLKSKVFRLKYCDPNEMMTVLNGLLDENDPPQQPMGGNPAGLPGLPGGGMLGVGGGGPGALGGGGLGALGVGGGGLGGFGGMGPQTQVTVDMRTRSLIVRASEKNLQLAADLVAVLDLPKDKPLPSVKSLKVFQLKHAEAEELVQVLQNLEPEARMIALGEAKLMIVAGPDAAMKEIADLVKHLDVPAPEVKPEEQRKLLKEPKGME